MGMGSTPVFDGAKIACLQRWIVKTKINVKSRFYKKSEFDIALMIEFDCIFVQSSRRKMFFGYTNLSRI